MTDMHFSDLKGKIVVITGATGLIGKALCRGFIDQGSTLIITSRNKENGKQLEKELNELQIGESTYFKLDISKEKNVKDLISFLENEFSRLDVFINCSWPKTDDWMENVEKVPFESIKQNLVQHLGGYFLCSQKAAILMKKQKLGSIINFSSIYGVVGPNFSIYNNTEMTCPPVYPLIKGGIITMTKYFATYFAKYNIKVNCISPGGIFNHQDSNFVKRYGEHTPLGKMGKPNDITGVALFLASESSSYITGQNILVDGGWTAW